MTVLGYVLAKGGILLTTGSSIADEILTNPQSKGYTWFDPHEYILTMG